MLSAKLPREDSSLPLLPASGDPGNSLSVAAPAQALPLPSHGRASVSLCVLSSSYGHSSLDLGPALNPG